MRIPPMLSYWLVFVLASGLASCASGPGNNASQRQAHKDLERGECPGFIVYPGERTEFGRQRYGSAEADAHLARYRDREFANCTAKLAAGDANAMRVLAEYGYVREDASAAASAYKTYVEKGSDPVVLAEASVALYNLYSTGEGNLDTDPEAAFYYLGVAVEYDVDTVELVYANTLHERGLYADAYSYFDRILNDRHVARRRSTLETCEINFKLADMYFRGRGVRENWYIGYYYWLEAGALAGDPRWGACNRNSFVYRDRYTIESERKQAADRRIGSLSKRELMRVTKAWENKQQQGLDYVASLEFRRPALVVVPVPSRPQTASTYQASATGTGSWPVWQPLSRDICQMHAAGNASSWSDVFQLRSGAIWTVASSVGANQTRGSAVAVAPNRLVTNCHIIQAPSQVTVGQGGRSLPVNVVAADRESDRCILQTMEALPVYATSARRQGALLIGEDVAAIGNPRGLDTSVSRGIVAQKRDKRGRGYIQTDAAISAGSSGGGLFDARGNLIGITTFKVKSGESLNFAIAIEEFCRM